ncbi:hypothetical protein BDV27DRAFT_130384 [Aspergillus caelatus]|uniref:Uncharacterized protein n=1 Tax=Aspergillus caelatus TaxID=61420 RepID=A0A5N7A0A7_9EURO|nr:uncharacterized protein BDV27DRAFT_130384 [Aspergillus caelatus]KAE8363115.1 hypothetical protein BDV27DRAFT_130384 [Aspergillus caelatus]
MYSVHTPYLLVVVVVRVIAVIIAPRAVGITSHIIIVVDQTKLSAGYLKPLSSAQ